MRNRLLCTDPGFPMLSERPVKRGPLWRNPPKCGNRYNGRRVQHRHRTVVRTPRNPRIWLDAPGGPRPAMGDQVELFERFSQSLRLTVLMAVCLSKFLPIFAQRTG